MAHGTPVDIIMPSYGHAAYLRETIESVLAQTHQEWRLTIQDDLSPDDSYDIARSFADARITVLRNEANLGTYGTEQKALEQGQAEFVAVMNSDDAWHPEKLQRQLAAIGDAPLCYALGSRIDKAGNRLPDDQHGDWPRKAKQDLAPWLPRENRVLASSVLFRREGLRFDPQLRYTGDWTALLRASLRGPAAFVDAELSSWRIHDTNSFRFSPTLLAEETAVRQTILDQYPSPADARAECARHLAALYALRGETWASIRAAALAFRLDRSRASFRRWVATLLGGKALLPPAGRAEALPTPLIRLAS